jgi:hypothetical protein
MSLSYKLAPNGVQNTVGGGGTPVQFLFGDLQTDGVSNFTSLNNITLPDGVYLITFECPWPYFASGLRGVYIKKDGVTVAEDEKDPDNVAPHQTLTSVLEGGGNFTFNAYQNSGGSHSFVGAEVRIEKVA